MLQSASLRNGEMSAVGQPVSMLPRANDRLSSPNRGRFLLGQGAVMDALHDPFMLLVLSMVHPLSGGKDGEHCDDEEKSFQIPHGEGRDGGTGG